MAKQHEEIIRRAEPGGTEFSPLIGDATAALGKHLVEHNELPSQEAFDRLVDESIEVLSLCPDFNGPATVRTGLIVGYVQSGKTMSMTTVASLARDNGCMLVILLAGTTMNLLKQTAQERLRPYLNGKPDPGRGWRLIDTVETTKIDTSRIRNHLRDWQDPAFPDDRKRPYFITVMKQHTHLGELAATLRSLSLGDVPTLVIDDEADQAGLDTNAAKKGRGELNAKASTTHLQIRAIRDALPHHTYLQYTATPQAPLLISLADLLSPDFCHVLTPGKGYTGGQAFFVDHPGLVQRIPFADLFSAQEPPPAPPESLQHAMLDFLVGCAAGDVAKETKVRSMLVHPSRIKADHAAFVRFVNNLRATWRRQLQLPTHDAAHQAFLEDLRLAYERVLAGAHAQLPDFEQVAKTVRWTLADTLVWEVNSNDGREVDWTQGRLHILVGGDKLNRGYTVQGLTVTYMPRPPGSWSADTIQQRARFFGYKQSYLPKCRVYLHPEIADAYEEYVTHEEDLRSQLRAHAGRPLREWKRAFFMEHRMRPTRSNVLSQGVLKPKQTGWFRQSHPHMDARAVEENRTLVNALVAELEFTDHAEAPRHRVATIPLAALLEKLALDYRCLGPDGPKWTALQLWISDLHKANLEAQCLVIQIQGGAARKRGEDKRYIGRINQLFEGKRDQVLRDPELVTVQLHRLNVEPEEGITVTDVPALAVHMPDGYEGRHVQVQSGAR